MSCMSWGRATWWVRGPLGNWFPMDAFKGKNLIVIGGGIGVARRCAR